MAVTGMQISRVGRLVAALAMAVAVWAVATSQASDAAEPMSTGGAASEVMVVVAKGDTLWELVLPYAPAGADAHGWIADVASHNDVQPQQIQAGDVVRIPIP